MVGIHVEFRMKPGMAETLMEWKRREGELQRATPGFVKRSMSRSVEDPNLFWYVSYWRTEEQMLGFLRSPHFEKVIGAVGVRDVIESRTVSRIVEVFDDRGERPEG